MIETKKIGNKIADARKKLNISQAQLAEQLFISQQAVGKWERGESMPDIVTLNRLAEILGVDFNYFSENFQSSYPETSNGQLKQPADSANQNTPVWNMPRTDNQNKPAWDMSQGNWIDADFSGLKNLHEKFSSSNMQRCKFIGSDLSGLILKHNNIDGCDFSDTDFSKSQIQGSNLRNDKFNGSTLEGARFADSNLEKCDFTGADFSGTEFSGSFLTGCDLSNADFTGLRIERGGLDKCTISNVVWNQTSFIASYFGEVIFEGELRDCSFDNCGFKKVTFRNATLLNTFFKNNSKMNKVEFINCKADRITYAFLKSNKAKLDGVRFTEE